MWPECMIFYSLSFALLIAALNKSNVLLEQYYSNKLISHDRNLKHSDPIDLLPTA